MSWKFNPFTGSLDQVNDLYKGASSAAPASPITGTMYYDTDDATLYVYDGGWVAIGSGTPASYKMLLESGDNFALESGDLMRVE